MKLILKVSLMLMIILCLPACSGSCPQNRAIYQQPASLCFPDIEWRETGDRIRVCTYNIQHLNDGLMDGWKRMPWQARRQACAAAAILDTINADLVFIQEIENLRILRTLNTCLAHPYAGGWITRFSSTHPRGRKQNVALLSRCKPVSVDEIDFFNWAHDPRPPRGALRVMLAPDEHTRLLLYGVHLKSNWGAALSNMHRRQAALQFIRSDSTRMAEAMPEYRWEIAVVGDMNVDPENEAFWSDSSLQPLSDWHDLWTGRSISERTTIPARMGDPDRMFPSAAFDRIIASPALTSSPWRMQPLQVLARGVNTNNIFARTGMPDSDHVSDHYPVFTDIVR